MYFPPKIRIKLPIAGAIVTRRVKVKNELSIDRSLACYRARSESGTLKNHPLSWYTVSSDPR